MVAGIVTIAVAGLIIDVVVLVSVLWRGSHWTSTIVPLMHLLYSAGVSILAAPILRLHIGFVSRNELADEWKRNTFNVVRSKRTSMLMAVDDLSDDEFNERFESFEYDPERNEFDKGVVRNCLLFWCTRRWRPDQMGEF